MRAARVVTTATLVGGATVLGCRTSGECDDAIARADSCGVHDLEVEDDLHCGKVAACRSRCVIDASCDDVRKSFAGGHDRTTPAWKCYEACGI